MVQLLGLLCGLLTRRRGFHLRSFGHSLKVNVLWGIGGFGLGFPLTLAAQWVQSHLGAVDSGNAMIGLVSRGNPLQLQALLFVVAGVTPLTEELWYRGAILESLRSRCGNRLAWLLSALFFAFIHADPGAFLPLLALGGVFGYLYLRTGSLVPGVIAHGLWNATSFFLVRLAVV